MGSMKKLVLLIDMDSILVDFFPYWLNKYNFITGEVLTEEDVTDYNIQELCKFPEILDYLLELPGFFREVQPISGAVKYFNKLLEDDHEVLIVTQLPRKSDFAANDKRKWIKKYLPNFPLENLIFTHKKYYVRGNIMFDDCPNHIKPWKKKNPKGFTAKIKYAYNKDCKTNWTFTDKNKAWSEFYEKVKQMSLK